MDEAAFDAEAHVAHMASMLGLAIAPDWRPGVSAHMAAIARAAALVMDFDLADEAESAVVFEP